MCRCTVALWECFLFVVKLISVDCRFTGIVVDYVKGGSGAVIPVMFVATGNLYIEQYYWPIKGNVMTASETKTNEC